MADATRKSDQAFRTIGELAGDLGVPQHILRYWETRFPQLRPLQRAGNRRYYRPADVELARRIHRLLGAFPGGVPVRRLPLDQAIARVAERARLPLSPTLSPEGERGLILEGGG